MSRHDRDPSKRGLAAMSTTVSRRGLLQAAGVGVGAGAAALSPLSAWSSASASPVRPEAEGSAGAPRSAPAFVSSLLPAIELGCGPMQRVFNPDDSDIPWFGHASQPELNGRSRFGFSSAFQEAHVPGRHLMGLLEAQSIGVPVSSSAVRKHRNALYFSLSREVFLPQNRASIDEEKPRRFLPHNVREVLHGLFALYAHVPAESEQARRAFERVVDTVGEFWSPDAGWDHDALRAAQSDLEIDEWDSGRRTLITGLGRAIGPLTRFWRLSVTRDEESTATRALLDRLVPEVLTRFPASGILDGELQPGHSHSITCTMSGLANYAYETDDAEVMGRVRAFYRLGLSTIRDEFGWSAENKNQDHDIGEANNTGDILETALLLGHTGDTVAYADAAQIVRGHLLPAQLVDSSWMFTPSDPWDDSERNVADRLQGAFGFPTPYGHLASTHKGVSFNLDIVGGSVTSLVFAHKAAVRRDRDRLVVALPIDHDSDLATVSVDQGEDLRVNVAPKRSGNVEVAVPQWVDPAEISVSGARKWELGAGGASVVIRGVTHDMTVTVTMPAVERTVHLGHSRRDIRALMRGDTVLAMDSFGQELAFFPDYPDDAPDEARGEVVRWSFADVAGNVVEAESGLARHRLSLLDGATAGPLSGAPGGHALRLGGDGAIATVGMPSDLNFGTAGFSISTWVRTSMQGRGRILSKGSFGYTPGYFLSVGHGGDGHIGFGVGGGAIWWGGGAIETTSADPVVGDGKWHHVCATYDGRAREVRLYVDGTAVNQTQTGGTVGHVFGDVLRHRETSPAIGASHLALTVGAHVDRRELFVGDVADLRMFGRGIQSQAVTDLARR